MLTFSQFRSLVIPYFNPGGTTAQLAFDAIASYVKYKIEREVNQDLERSKSYYNTFLERKLMLAGGVPPIFSVAQPEVLTRITVDAQRTAVTNFVNEYIQEGIDDMAGANGAFESQLRSACVDLQRKVMCYQSNNKSYYNISNTTSDGLTSVVDISATSIDVMSVSTGRYEAPLTAQAYAVDALVQSNGRIYKVSTAGTVSAVGAGLTSVNGVEEILGTAGFKYDDSMHWTPVESINWLARDALLDGREAGGPYYFIDPANQSLSLYPMLIDSTRQMRLEYNGIKFAFSDVDPVPYGVAEGEVVAHYIKGYLALGITQDQRMAQTELAAYTAGVRRLWVDCQRQQSTVLSR